MWIVTPLLIISTMRGKSRFGRVVGICVVPIVVYGKVLHMSIPCTSQQRMIIAHSTSAQEGGSPEISRVSSCFMRSVSAAVGFNVHASHERDIDVFLGPGESPSCLRPRSCSSTAMFHGHGARSECLHIHHRPED